MTKERWDRVAIIDCISKIILESSGTSLTVTPREIQKRLHVKDHPTRIISPSQRLSRQIREILLEMGFNYVPASLNGKRPGKYQISLSYSQPKIKFAQGMCAL